MFKLVPVIEAQSPGRSLELMKGLNAEYIVVTYPVKSLRGKSKGMEKNYSESFERMISGNFNIIGRKVVGNELVYIIRN